MRSRRYGPVTTVIPDSRGDSEDDEKQGKLIKSVHVHETHPAIPKTK